MRTALFLFVALATPAWAQNITDLALPVVQFVPMQQADGSRTWRFVTQPRGADEATILSMLAGEMGKARWCADGWEILSRQTVSGALMLEGRCKPHQ